MLSTFLTSAVIALSPTEEASPDLIKRSTRTPDIYTTISIDSVLKKKSLLTKYTQRFEIAQEIRIEQIQEEITNLCDTIEDLLIATDAGEIEYLTKEEYGWLATTDLELIDLLFTNEEIWETEKGLQEIEFKVAKIKSILSALTPAPE
ncbi:MAG: hypothetical protein LBO09_08960 [Candidatus Peribacteria bacterium]|jgi:hypothetical protein|nr:hypothetical protein [Candidatus Peribacteria bacterium]